MGQAQLRAHGRPALRCVALHSSTSNRFRAAAAAAVASNGKSKKMHCGLHQCNCSSTAFHLPTCSFAHQAVQQNDGAGVPAQRGLPHNGAARREPAAAREGRQLKRQPACRRRRRQRRRQLTQMPASWLDELLLASSGTPALQRPPLGKRGRDFAASCKRRRRGRPERVL